MKKFKSIGLKACSVFASLALVLGVASAQATLCFIVFHQPKVPKGMSKFLKNG